MAFSTEELLKLTPDEIAERYQSTKCARCGSTLHENVTGARPMHDGFACSDCYFADLGKGIEEHALGVPRRRVGGLRP